MLSKLVSGLCTLKGGCSNSFSFSFKHLTTDIFLIYRYLYVTLFKIQSIRDGMYQNSRLFALLTRGPGFDGVGFKRKVTMVAKGYINQHLENPSRKTLSFRPARAIQRVYDLLRGL